MNDEGRWLDTTETARYLSVNPGALPRLVRDGRIPAPNYQLGPRSPRWHSKTIDKFLLGTINDGVGGTSSTNAITASRANAEKIHQGARRARRALPTG